MPNDAEIQQLFVQGFTLHQQGALANALVIYQQVSRLDPQHFDALHMQAVVYLQAGQFQTAQPLFQQAIELNPQNDPAHVNLALVYEKTNQWVDAHQHLDRAISLNPINAVAWNNKGNLLNKAASHTDALRCFDQAIAANPGYAEALTNRASTLLKLGQVDEALTAFQSAFSAAIQSNPSQIQAYHGMGLIHKQKKQNELAQRCFEKVIASDPRHADAHFNLGMIHHDRKDYALALQAYSMAAQIKPAIDYLTGYRRYAKNAICDWSDMEDETHRMEQGIHAGQRAAPPFYFLSIFDRAETQYKAARVIAADLQGREALATPSARAPGARSQPDTAREKGPRIRIGYLSSDFRLHAVARLLVELIELHDRSAFEVYGFCWSPEDGSAMRERISGAFDHFIKIHDLTDAQAAETIEECNMDVLVDLQGMTKGARPGILMRRPCNAIQISYLGMPGTSGLPSMDYIVGDDFVFPPALEPFMSEKPLRLPVCFQVSDRQREAPAPLTRADCDLPQDAFVFAVFNNSYKITPAIFLCWMRILAATPGSVLWLIHDNPSVVQNLKLEAKKAGVDPARLFFAEKADTGIYMGRLALPDLVLDTFPYNAGTIANDLLWMGTPILTLCGESYVSRMCGSLLMSVHAPEFITHHLGDYEKRAIELAHDHAALKAFRCRMTARDQPLFDTPRWVRSYEAAIAQLLPGGVHSRPQQ